MSDVPAPFEHLAPVDREQVTVLVDVDQATDGTVSLFAGQVDGFPALAPLSLESGHVTLHFASNHAAPRSVYALMRMFMDQGSGYSSCPFFG
jgi:hypothetical protein